MAKRPRAEFHPSLEPEDDLAPEDQARGLRSGVIQPADPERAGWHCPCRGQDLFGCVARAEGEVVKPVHRYVAARPVGRERHPEGKPPVSHVGKDEEKLPTVKIHELYVLLDVREDAARDGHPRRARLIERLAGQGNSALLEDPLGHEGKLRPSKIYLCCHPGESRGPEHFEITGYRCLSRTPIRDSPV